MDENELKSTIGEAAFNAMSAEQRTAILAKFTPAPAPKPEPKPEPKPAPKETPAPEGDLIEKARLAREAGDTQKQTIRQIEGAVTFNQSVADFVKNNEALLPSEIKDILKVAEKETYDSAVEKANVLKASMIQSFFSVQSNVDLLTPSHKLQVDDYLKLTKNGKEQKAEAIYENLFEPTMKLLKQIKKAEEVGKARSGFASSSKSEDAYKEKLMNVSRKTHLGEKGV